MPLNHHDRDEATLVGYIQQLLGDETYDLSDPDEVAEPEKSEPAKRESAESQTAAAKAPESAPAAVTAPEPEPVPPRAAVREIRVSDIDDPAAEPVTPFEGSYAHAAVPAAETETETSSAEVLAPEHDHDYDHEHDHDLDHGPDHDQDDDPGLQYREAPHEDTALPYAEAERPHISELLEQVSPEVAAAQAVPAVTTVKTEEVKPEVQAAAPAPAEPGLEWENIETPDEFQALFFMAQGVRFAVPLVDLGGIFECDHTTPLFGKPAWYKGLADIRGRKINVVDTLRWVKPEVSRSSDFKYIILLGDSLWSICCDKLEGNRHLRKENVKWRKNAGNRPWLAGIVKKEMCALLHVSALITMFGKGFNLKDLHEQDEEH